MTVQVKASSAIEAMCTDNPANQDEFLAQDTPKYLIRLLKVRFLFIILCVDKQTWKSHLSLIKFRQPLKYYVSQLIFMKPGKHSGLGIHPT